MKVVFFVVVAHADIAPRYHCTHAVIAPRCHCSHTVIAPRCHCEERSNPLHAVVRCVWIASFLAMTVVKQDSLALPVATHPFFSIIKHCTAPSKHSID